MTEPTSSPDMVEGCLIAGGGQPGAEMRRMKPAALSYRVGPRQSDNPRQGAGRDRIALHRFRRYRRPRGRVRESRLHFAQESLERIDARGHLGDQGEFGAVGGDRLAGGLEGGEPLVTGIVSATELRRTRW